MPLHDITTFDYSIAALLIFFLLRGLCIGFVRQLAATVALVGSYWLAGEYVSQVIPYVQQFIERPGAVFLVSFGGLFLLFALFFTLIGHWLHNVLEVNLLGWLNRLTGGILGVARGALVMVLLYMFLAAVLPSAHPLFEGSVAVPYLNQGAEIIRQFIRDVSVRNDLRPRPAQKANAQEKKPSKTQAPAETKKVESTTIPDQVEPITPPVPEQQNSQGPAKR